MGLKPLTVGDQRAAPKEAEAGATPDQVKKAANTYIDQDTNTEFEHVPAKNLAAIAEQKKFKQRLDEQREKRRQLERLKEVKGLGDESDDEPPADAHAAKTDQAIFGKILRRNMPYGTVTDHGTMFVGFSADQTRLSKMLESMAGLIGGQRDALTYYSRPVTGAYYFIPAIESLRPV